jgi:hypothetical protein
MRLFCGDVSAVDKVALSWNNAINSLTVCIILLNHKGLVERLLQIRDGLA